MLQRSDPVLVVSQNAPVVLTGLTYFIYFWDRLLFPSSLIATQMPMAWTFECGCTLVCRSAFWKVATLFFFGRVINCWTASIQRVTKKIIELRKAVQRRTFIKQHPLSLQLKQKDPCVCRWKPGHCNYMYRCICSVTFCTFSCNIMGHIPLISLTYIGYISCCWWVQISGGGGGETRHAW